MSTWLLKSWFKLYSIKLNSVEIQVYVDLIKHTLHWKLTWPRDLDLWSFESTDFDGPATVNLVIGPLVKLWTECLQSKTKCNTDVKFIVIFYMASTTFLHSVNKHEYTCCPNVALNTNFDVVFDVFVRWEMKFLWWSEAMSMQANEFAYYRDQLWTAPELLRMTTRPINGTQKADVYSFAIVLQEIMFRTEPYFIDIDTPQCMLAALRLNCQLIQCCL